MSSAAAIEVNSAGVSELCGAREEETDETESVRVCIKRWWQCMA